MEVPHLHRRVGLKDLILAEGFFVVVSLVALLIYRVSESVPGRCGRAASVSLAGCHRTR